MKTRPKRTLPIVFLFFCILAVSLNIGVAHSSDEQASEVEATPQGLLNVHVQVFLSDNYDVWNLNVHHDVEVNLTINLEEPPPTKYELSTRLLFYLKSVSGLPLGANYTYAFWGYPPTGTLIIEFPANVTHASVLLKGHSISSSVLWRNSAEIFYSYISSSLELSQEYKLTIIPPSHSKMLRIYSRFYPNLPVQEKSVDGRKAYLVPQEHPKSPIVVLYEPSVWEPYAVSLMLLLIFSILAIPFIYKRKFKKIKKISEITNKPPTIIIKSRLETLVNHLKRVDMKFKKLDSSKLLQVYVLCALLMVSLSFSFGPDPRIRLYVLSSTRENAKIVSDFLDGQGAFTLTIFDEMCEFKLLSDMGVFSGVVIGDFYPPSQDFLRRWIYPALDVAPNIIILKNYAYSDFAEEVRRRYGRKTIFVDDLNDLSLTLTKIDRRTNPLGLEIPVEAYLAASAFVGFCSFLIVFFGFAFLASKSLEAGKKPGLSGFPVSIAYAFLFFFFTQTIYMVCSVLLAMPLGLHTSTPKVTAIGFMGFGGGSRPRMLSGILGILFGAYLSSKEGLKLSRDGIVAFLILFFFILIDPLTQGIIFYEFVLLYSVGPAFETAFTTWTYIREFLGTIGLTFGGEVTPVYSISRGIILYYAGVIPLVLLPKLKRATGTVALFICAFWAASGGIRVADMMPWKSVASSIPGVVAGLFFSIILLLVSFGEKVIRAKIGEPR